MANVLKLKSISMNFHEDEQETAAIKDVSFGVKSGEFVSIVGPSGCGKTTLLSIISGLLKPSQGEVLINSKNGETSIGYMLQKDHLLEWRTILQNVLLGLEIKNTLTEENINYASNLLDKYGLKDFKEYHPSKLSGGMRQRAALIRTLAVKPDILLLDEPFSSLDYQTRLYVSDEIWGIIRRENKTAILVTHDISEAVSMSDRVVVLTKRPSSVYAIHEIKLTCEGERSPMKAREAPEFRHYFNTIWKELDVHD